MARYITPPRLMPARGSIVPRPYLVLGATGGLGSAVLRRLDAEGEPVRVLVRDADAFKEQYPQAKAEVVEGDLKSKPDIDRAVDGARAVFHCVAPDYFNWGDLIGHTRRLLEAAEEEQERVDVVFPSNVWVFGASEAGTSVKEDAPHEPPTCKGTIQANIERCLREAKGRGECRIAVVRFPDLYGPGLECLAAERVFRRAATGKAVQWPGPLDVPRELVLVDDAADAMLIVARSERAWGEAWHVPGPAAITPRELVTMAFEEAGHAPHMEEMGALAHRAKGFMSTDWKQEHELLYLYQRPMQLDGTRFRRAFGRLPATPYREGVKRTMAWWKERLDAK